MFKACILSEILITPRVAGNADVNTPVPEVAAIQPIILIWYYLNDNTKFLENLKQGLKKKQFLRGNIDLK